MGNRGILHNEAGQLGAARWRHKAWVTCVLEFKNRRRKLMQPGNYTELFFHDEAVAFAAGHRPCGECRRADYNRFRDTLGITGKITNFDALLHQERAIPRRAMQRRHQADLRDMPTGAFVLDEDGTPMLVQDDAWVPFLSTGYGRARIKPRNGQVALLTPPLLVAALKNGYTLDARA
ncbi:MAG: hypothetical protein AAF727_17220 [Pseudomonadota bacterium]